MGSGCRNADGMLFRQIHEHSVPGVRDGLEAMSDVKGRQVTGEAAGAWRWQGTGYRQSLDFAFGV